MRGRGKNLLSRSPTLPQTPVLPEASGTIPEPSHIELGSIPSRPAQEQDGDAAHTDVGEPSGQEGRKEADCFCQRITGRQKEVIHEDRPETQDVPGGAPRLRMHDAQSRTKA